MNSSAALVGILIAGGIGAAIAWNVKDKKQAETPNQTRLGPLPPGLRRSPGQPQPNQATLRFPFPFAPVNVRQAQTAGVKRTGACCASCAMAERLGIPANCPGA